MTVCNAVRQLLYDCGDELGWCFTEDQVNDGQTTKKNKLCALLRSVIITLLPLSMSLS